MSTPPRKHLSLWLSGLLLLSIVISLSATSPVRAGGAIPVLPGGSSLRPGSETPIQLVSEMATIDIRPATAADNSLVELNPMNFGLRGRPIWFPAIAEVQADFTLENPTGEAISTTAWFPLASALENAAWSVRPEADVPRLTSFEFSVNASPLDYTIRELPNPQGSDAPPLPWAGFPLTVPAGGETMVSIRYKIPLRYSGNEMLLYYDFQSGGGWAGPIGQVELTLNLPYPASAKTLAGMPPESLRLPPYVLPDRAVDLPPGAILQGNQVRLTWKDLEPGLNDLFAIALLTPAQWQELESARAAVTSKPQDGRVWLDLAATYSRLSWNDWSNLPAIFGSSYDSPGIEAYQKAIDLLPDHPAPHAGLGLLTLAPYLPQKNAPPDALHSAQEEYRIARELDAKDPSLLKQTGASGGILGKYEAGLLGKLDRALAAYLSDAPSSPAGNLPTTTLVFQNDATATAFALSWSCWAETGIECIPTVHPTATPAPTSYQASTPTTYPSPPQELESTPTVTPALSLPNTEDTGISQNAVIILSVLISLVVLGFLVYRLLRRSRTNSQGSG